MANQDQDFGSLMADVTPLRLSGRRWLKPQKQCNRASLDYAKQAATQTVAASVDAHSAPVMMDVEQRLCFQRSMMPAHTVRQLRAGRLRPSLEIDLHGRTVKQARSDILLALDKARREGELEPLGPETLRPTPPNQLYTRVSSPTVLIGSDWS